MSNTTTTVPALILRRTFDAPRERVFDAWLTPNVMSEFMGPGEVKATDISVDARTGGKYSITMDTPKGKMIASGVYREIRRPERIQCTWVWQEDDPADERETLLNLDFHDRGSQTELVLTHEQLRDDESRASHEHGWVAILENLERIFGAGA
jgi:uncharacterized protein YndB with AHSA1/START domain